jgi:hypothetical protein
MREEYVAADVSRLLWGVFWIRALPAYFLCDRLHNKIAIMSMNSQKTTYFSVLETFYSLGKLEMAQIFRKFAPKLTIQAFIPLQKWTNTYPKSPNHTIFPPFDYDSKYDSFFI